MCVRERERDRTVAFMSEHSASTQHLSKRRLLQNMLKYMYVTPKTYLFELHTPMTRMLPLFLNCSFSVIILKPFCSNASSF